MNVFTVVLGWTILTSLTIIDFARKTLLLIKPLTLSNGKLLPSANAT